MLNVLAYNLMHAARLALEEATGEGWSLRRLRERVLRVAARVLVHGCRAILMIATQAAALWNVLWGRLELIRENASTLVARPSGS